MCQLTLGVPAVVSGNASSLWACWQKCSVTTRSRRSCRKCQLTLGVLAEVLMEEITRGDDQIWKCQLTLGVLAEVLVEELTLGDDLIHLQGLAAPSL